MKALLVTLSLPLLFALTGHGQSPSTVPAPGQTKRPGADSFYYVHLLDGTTLYSSKVQLINSLIHGKYLLLDSNRRISLGQARDFKGWDGNFAVGSINGVYDVFRLQNEGPRISLYSKCFYETETVWSSPAPGIPQTPTTITTREKAWFFRKGADSGIQRVTIDNLRGAMADNPASLAEVTVAGTNMHVAIGLLAAGAGATVAGIIVTHQRNTDAFTSYQKESAAWYANSMTNPNAPMPTLPHYGLSPLFYVGSAMVLSSFIPIFGVRKHLVKALDIYNSAP
jgi:hypothetical protein